MTSKSVGFCLWEAMFKSKQRVVMLGLNVGMTKHMCDVLHFALDNMPEFIKPIMKIARRTEVLFDTGSRIHIAVMTNNCLRGMSCDRLYLDAYALAPPLVQKDIWLSIAPQMSMSCRVIVASTPGSRNDPFHMLWVDSQKPQSSFTPFLRTLDDLNVSAAYKQTLRNQVGELSYRRDFMCEFV
jgi:hypothetical protein